MADPVNATTLVGLLVAALVGLVPVGVTKLLSRRSDDADASESLASGAGAVTTAALALLHQMQEDRDACRAELEAMNARLDQLHGQNVGKPPPPD